MRTFTYASTVYVGLGKEMQTSGGDDGIDICILRKSFHAFLFAHVENQTFFYHVLHLYTYIYHTVTLMYIYPKHVQHQTYMPTHKSNSPLWEENICLKNLSIWYVYHHVNVCSGRTITHISFCIFDETLN